MAGFKGSFFPGSYNRKRYYVRRFINIFEKLETEMLPPDPETKNPYCGNHMCAE